MFEFQTVGTFYKTRSRACFSASGIKAKFWKKNVWQLRILTFPELRSKIFLFASSRINISVVFPFSAVTTVCRRPLHLLILPNRLKTFPESHITDCYCCELSYTMQYKLLYIMLATRFNLPIRKAVNLFFIKLPRSTWRKLYFNFSLFVGRCKLHCYKERTWEQL